VVGGSIALAAWGRIRARAERRSAAPEILQLLRHLAEEIESGSDLFASLGMVLGFLPEGLVRRAVDRSIEGYAQRLPLADCLRPLGAVNPILAGLAADMRRIGWEASPELADAVRLVRADAFRRWDRKRWNRVLADRIAGLLPHLRGFAAGAASAGLLVLAPAAAVGATRAKGRTVPGPLSAHSARDRLPEPLPVFTHAVLPIDDFIPDRDVIKPAEVCRVDTGVSGGWANVRERPTVSSRVNSYVKEGVELEVLNEKGDFAAGSWLLIRSEEGGGWIYAPLCSRNGD
jgi:hypothetical protein